MINPGSFILAARGITVAIAGEAQTAIDGLEGITAASISARLSYGSGGTTVKVWVQVSLDGGESFMDIACFAFTTASAVKVANLSGLTPIATPVTPTDGALADDTFVNGIMGSIWRAKISSTGAYSNTLLELAIEAR